jgi:DNA polymerase-3 subunit alpha (Gram-positive type)
LPPGGYDPVVKSLRAKREENRLTVELDGAPPPPGWTSGAGRNIQRFMNLASVAFTAPAETPPAPAKPQRRKAAEPAQSEILFGKPPRLTVTDIDALPREAVKACVSGRVFMLGERRERRMRIQNRWKDAVSFEFYLTDGTGAVAARCVFEKGKEPPELEARLGGILAVKGHVTVYGETESYTVMDREEWRILTNCVEETKAPQRQDTAPEKRVELHLHTKMSADDAVTSVSEVFAAAARWGHPAVAITDHGVCHAFPEAMDAAKKYGIKALYGCEGYLAPPEGKKRYHHVLLLARTQQGLQNLYRLVSLSHIDHFKRRPLIPKEELTLHREGLIVGSACERGELFTAVREGLPFEELLQIADYYDMLEIQPSGNNEFLVRDDADAGESRLQEWNRTIVALGKALGKPVCATGDVHFLDPEDSVYRDVLQNFREMDIANPPPLYFKTTDQMLREFSYLGEEDAWNAVVAAPVRLAESFEDVRPVRPGEFFPRIDGSAEELRALAYGRARELYGEELPPLIGERLEKEIGSIIRKGYDIIYAISQKLVARSEENGFLVGSRGSVGSSIAAYFAGITEVNALPPHYRCPVCRRSEFPGAEDLKDVSCGIDLPEKNCPCCGAVYDRDGFDIPFATFLGFDADKKPDIDLNFSSIYHERAGEHLIELFGEDKVFRAGTITTIKEKTAVGYALKYTEKHAPGVPNAELLRLAKGCEGVKTTTGQHPGGMIIVPQELDIYEFCPVHRAANKKDGKICTHFDYHAIEDNLLKMDLLGHDCPTFLGMFDALTGEKGQNLPLNDPETLSIFSASKALGYENDDLIGPVGTVGIPEYGTRFVRGMLQKTQPSTFDELVRIAGLSHGEGVWRGNAETLIDDGKATLKNVICARDDITLYLVARGIPGKQSLTISESVRKGRGLKPEWEEEMRGAGVPGWYIQSCKDIKYLFPKAHAAAYAMMSARIAWHKVHKPEVFYAVYFTLKIDDFSYEKACKDIRSVKNAVKNIEGDKNLSKSEQDKAVVLEVVYEMLRRGIVFEPPDVHTSDASRFRPAGPGRVSVPLMALSGLGLTAAQSIADEREKNPFLAEDNLLTRCRPVTKAHVESLRSAGALGGMPETAQTSLFS